MDRVFTIEQLRPIKDGMTISKDAKMGTATGVTFFSLGKDTSISQECYDATAVYIGAKGDATFLIGENADKKNFTEGDCLIVPGGTLCGMETVTGTVYTEMIIKKENTMNNIIKSGEVMKLKDLISYEEGSIANLDVVSNDTMKFVLMAFDEGTGLTPHRAPGNAIIFALEAASFAVFTIRESTRYSLAAYSLITGMETVISEISAILFPPLTDTE